MSDFLTLFPLEFAKWLASGENMWLNFVNSWKKTDHKHQNV